MNKIILLLLPICLLAVACESLAPTKDPKAAVALAPLKDVVACPGNGHKKITIIANEAQFSVAPPHLCVEANDVITVNFTGQHAAGVIKLEAKTYIDADWLSVSNPGTNPDKATITVPADTKAALYLYNVTATGWGTIDPMISIDE